jgi:hypothetical protein
MRGAARSAGAESSAATAKARWRAKKAKKLIWSATPRVFTRRGNPSSAEPTSAAARSRAKVHGAPCI